MEEEMLTVQQVARELSVTDGTVRQAILDGRLPARVIFGRKVIHRNDVEEYRRRTRPTGEKPRGRPRRHSDDTSV